ncbi:MAG: sensor histidine kinase [Opitutales bacterium]
MTHARNPLPNDPEATKPAWLSLGLFSVALCALIAINLGIFAEKISAVHEHENAVKEIESRRDEGVLLISMVKQQSVHFEDAARAGLDSELGQRAWVRFQGLTAEVIAVLETMQGRPDISEMQTSIIEELLDEHIPYYEGKTLTRLQKMGAAGVTTPRRNATGRRTLIQNLRELEEENYAVVSQAAFNASRELSASLTSSYYQMAGIIFLGLFLVAYYVYERVGVERSLSRAVRRSEAGNIAKAQFLNCISRDTQAPLEGILKMAQTIKTNELNEETQQHVETLRGSGENLLGILTDIVEYTETESEAFVLTTDDVHFQAYFDRITAPYHGAAQEKGIAFKVMYAGAFPETIRIAPEEVRSIVKSLVGNALKFTEEGYVTILAKWSPERKRVPATLDIEVHDSGIGVPQNQQDMLFDVFTQADMSDTRDFGGTGIGLSICAALTRKMGGTLSVRSNMGKGSIFTAKIPVSSWSGE